MVGPLALFEEGSTELHLPFQENLSISRVPAFKAAVGSIATRNKYRGGVFVASLVLQRQEIVMNLLV